LFALYSDAAHALITEDRAIHDKAREKGLVDRVYTIQTADDLLRRLHEQTHVRLPNIEDVALHNLTHLLSSLFFDSLRADYADFDDWFREKAREGRSAWVYWEDNKNNLGALCVYARQKDQVITDDGAVLKGHALKLCTFKVSDSSRGRKVGELFLKTAFRYASSNNLENIFVHGDPEQQHFLFQLLEDFGFLKVGTYKGDAMYVKQHPQTAPLDISDAFSYHRKYFPHFKHDEQVNKFVVPIVPEFHEILFPDYDFGQLTLFRPSNTAGNAIKLAYLSHAQLSTMSPGDIVLFYRSADHRAITSLGVVELYESLDDPNIIASRVSRRTVYSMGDIIRLAQTPTKVMLFRLAYHFRNPVPHEWLKSQGLISGNIQSIRKIGHQEFESILFAGL
jgi:predicted GNAT family N-acyltransferase